MTNETKGERRSVFNSFSKCYVYIYHIGRKILQETEKEVKIATRKLNRIDEVLSKTLLNWSLELDFLVVYRKVKL